jgi:hypothetical protein
LRETESVDILFFSRGRGRGHALPDLAILNALKTAQRVKPSVAFVSYGTGGRVLTEAGEHVLDLCLGDTAAVLDVIVAAGRMVTGYRPALIVSHEELGALCIAKIMGVPSIYLSHWLPAANDPYVAALNYADEVLVIEKERIRPEPPQVKGRVRCLGPVLRRFASLPSDRAAARVSLGIDPDTAVLLVAPGTRWGRASDEEGWFKLVLTAFDQLSNPNKRMLLVAGGDYEFVSSQTANRNDITVLREVVHVDRLMVASDVGVTTATYGISRELAALGIPSVSLSFGHNWIDDMFVRSIPTNTCLWAADADPVTLATCLESALVRGLAQPDVSALEGRGARVVAEAILSRLAKCGRPVGAIPAETVRE